MALVLTNPSGALAYGELFVPYCPAGAYVDTSRYISDAVAARPNTYAIERADWAAEARRDLSAARQNCLSQKRRLARVLFECNPHSTFTLHDGTTGQFVDVRTPPQPFGTFLASVVGTSVGQHNRKRDRQKRLTRMREEILECVEELPNSTWGWAAAFYELFDALSYSGMGRLTKLIEGKLDTTAAECDNCSHKAFYFEMVRTDRRVTAGWCVNCTENNATYLDSRGEYVDNDQMVGVDNDSFETARWYAEDNYYQNDDGDWCSEPQDRYDDDDSGSGSDSDDDNGADELHSYHSTKGRLRGWAMAPDGQPDISTGCWAPMTIGIELEVESIERRYNTVAPLVYALRNIIGDESLFAETDGSLDEAKGFELIFGWSDLPSWHRAMPRIGTALKEGEVISHDAGINYGLHVNVAVADNVFVQAAITWFINHNDNAKLLFALARRETTMYCPRTHGAYSPTDSHNAAVNFGNTAGVFKTDKAGKCVDCDSTIASFRLFRGTINPVRLMADIEFCHSLVSAATAYSYQFDPADGVLRSEYFSGFTMRYWQTHVLKNIVRYPTLVNYLRHWDKKGAKQHGAFTDRAMTRFISQYPMGALTGATHDGLDKRALALLNHTIASTEE